MSLRTRFLDWLTNSRQPKTHIVADITHLRPKNNWQSFASSLSSGGRTRKGMSSYQKKLILDHTALRNNTRVAVHDSPQARAIITRSRDSVIGSGLRINVMPAYEKLGLTQEQAEKWGENVAESFNLWAKSKKSDLTERNNFYQNMRLYAWMYGRDGEVFVRFTYSDDPTDINPLKISFIDPNQLNCDEWTDTLYPYTQIDGIEKDENGREIAYNVWIEDPTKPGKYKYVTIPARENRSGLPYMVHGFDPEYAGQSRGMPELGHSLQDFQDMTDYDNATVTKMKNSAALNFTIENDLKDPSDAGLSTLSTGNAGVVIDNTTTTTETPTTVSADTISAINLPESTLTEPGVNLLQSTQGDKIKLIDTHAPSDSAQTYITGKFDLLAASMSMPPEIAKMIFTNSHSASRGALGLYEVVKKIKINDIASDFLDPVFETWLTLEIASGRIQAPGFSDPYLRQFWTTHYWRGESLPDIDPLKTVQAIEKKVELGLTDLDTESFNANGSNGKSNRAKLARQIPELTPLSKTETTDPQEPADDDEETNQDME